MPTKLCKDCRTRQDSDQFPADKYGRIDTRHCRKCIGEHTPVLLTEQQAATRLGISVETFRSRNLKPAGSYTPAKTATIPLYARAEVDASGTVEYRNLQPRVVA